MPRIVDCSCFGNMGFSLWTCRIPIEPMSFLSYAEQFFAGGRILSGRSQPFRHHLGVCATSNNSSLTSLLAAIKRCLDKNAELLPVCLQTHGFCGSAPMALRKTANTTIEPLFLRRK